MKKIYLIAAIAALSFAINASAEDFLKGKLLTINLKESVAERGDKSFDLSLGGLSRSSSVSFCVSPISILLPAEQGVIESRRRSLLQQFLERGVRSDVPVRVEHDRLHLTLEVRRTAEPLDKAPHPLDALVVRLVLRPLHDAVALSHEAVIVECLHSSLSS